MTKLIDLGFSKQFKKNSPISFLMQKTIEMKKGKLGPNGEIIILTGSHTGRSADDKYVVMNEISKDSIWWENNIHQMSEENFGQLKKDVLKYLEDEKDLFYSTRSIGNNKHYSINIELLSTEPNAVHFSYYMFKENDPKAQDEYKILHAPHFKLDPKKYNTRSETVIVSCFKDKTTIIIGTEYAGEIKKSMFSTMNFLLPKLGILPMHSGSCANKQGNAFVFFGLSGTGKTTLSTDIETSLIGDDEHGLSDQGIFNFENGCYAKTFKLSNETEPAIYEASTQFSSYLENVTMNDDHSKIDFFDNKYSENGRASYPLTFIKDRIKSGEGSIPKDIFFLSADAFGVLPPISKLTSEQAKKYFVLGYTAKLAGTEIGVKSPKATFSSCFGAPFMLLKPARYAELLEKYISKYNMNVWLINTGWFGGAYGVGERFPLKITRELIRAVQNNELENVGFTHEEIFGHQIPNKVRDIDSKILFPELAWKNKDEYFTEARKLKNLFDNEAKKYF
jgi:phosphoenolpyruvate carboxykinase (ATP)